MGTTTSGVVTQAALKAIADRLRDRYGAERVLVYGSVARGTATEHSDIDLLVVAPTTERFYERMGSALAVVRDISRGLPLAPIVVTPEELSFRLARGDQFIQEIVETGVEL
jgi:predicted nucleotidyltransferase